MNVTNNATIYKIFLPNGKSVMVYFSGEKVLEKILDAYNIPYAKGKNSKEVHNNQLTKGIII